MSEKMLTVEEIAEELRVHPETVRQWIRDGELIAIDISKEYRILRSDLDCAALLLSGICSVDAASCRLQRKDSS